MALITSDCRCQVALFQSSIDVFNAEKQKVVQTIPCPEQGLCVADAGAGNAGRGHKVFVASAKKIFCLDPVHPRAGWCHCAP